MKGLLERSGEGRNRLAAPAGAEHREEASRPEGGRGGCKPKWGRSWPHRASALRFLEGHKVAVTLSLTHAVPAVISM